MQISLMFILFLSHTYTFGALNSSSGCAFPAQWRGSWFQSGEKTLITINGTRISNKGQCVEEDDDKFLIYDGNDKCFRCLVMHEKHPNIIQYKETYCTMGEFRDICSNLAGDATLYSLFRYNAAPSSCPFSGPLEFTYTRGDDPKTCMVPMSQADSCTQNSKLLLRFMACADVRGTESYNVELECLATWKEGSTQYLVARLNGIGVVNDEGRYRCFVYTKSGNVTWNLAQSGDASCNGLTSATDGAKTLKMIQKSESSHCSFPIWLVKPYSWIALDLTVSTRLLASIRNLTILDQHETHFTCHRVIRTKHTNLKYHFSHQSNNKFQVIARTTRSCTNGFVCMVFHKRDEHVMEIQQSLNWTHQEDDACIPSIFNSKTAPYTTFITMEPITRQCPYLGLYDVIFVRKPQSTDYNDSEPPKISNERNPINYGEHIAEVKASKVPTISPPARCLQTGVDRLNIGCTESDLMEFVTDCTDKTLFKYFCHGTWNENDTTYLVASTEAGRYCLVYSTSAATTTTTLSNRKLIVSGHLSSCPRALHLRKYEWQVNLTAFAQCEDVSSASTWRSFDHSLATQILFVLGGLTNRYFGR